MMVLGFVGLGLCSGSHLTIFKEHPFLYYFARIGRLISRAVHRYASLVAGRGRQLFLASED
jgi:hypothetical protein